MRNPNGYGTIVDLGKNRRRPLAVRITDGYKTLQSGRCVQNFRYLEYFDRKQKKEAMTFQNAYNNGLVPKNYKPGDGYEKYLSNNIISNAPSEPMPTVVATHAPASTCPTLEAIYKEWVAFKKSRKKPPSDSTFRNYDIAYRRFSKFHQRRLDTITVSELQELADSIQGKSLSTVDITKTTLGQLYDHAIINGYVKTNFCDRVTWEHTDSEEEKHIPFNGDEIKWLWSHSTEPFIDLILMMIYTGVRCSEFIQFENRNINLESRIIVGGIKTNAGKNRRIPIHDAVFPFFEKYYNTDNKYLVTTSTNCAFSYPNFKNHYWNEVMKRIGMEHTPHDTRHTFATLANQYKVDDLCLKLIVGHSVKDLTKRVYTHITDEELLAEINKIQIPTI